jgi:hypothetical protein
MTAPVRARPALASTVFHPERLVAVLARFKVAYILAGPIAARLHGSPLLTAGSDIVPSLTPENLEALSTALRHLGARVYTTAAPEGLEHELSAQALASADAWDLITSCGRLRVWFRPAGSAGYADLAADAVRFTLHGDEIAVASLGALVRLLEAPQTDDAPAQGAVLRSLLARSGG